MKESYWGYWLLVLGVFIIVVLLLVQSFTSTNTQDYYMVKTITEAAMEDAIDYNYFRTYGEAKINKEKFFESFLRRFSEEASLSTTYQITFADVYEAPPKVSVKVSSKAGGFSIVGDSGDIDIVNKIDAILESSEYSRSTGEYDLEGATTTYRVAANKLASSELTDAEKETVAAYKAKTSCKMTFNASMTSNDTCYGDANVIVQSCGKPNESGVSQGLNASSIYCVVYSKKDKSCFATIPIGDLDSKLKDC